MPSWLLSVDRVQIHNIYMRTWLFWSGVKCEGVRNEMSKKIGTVEILEISTRGRSYYLRLSKDLVEAFGLKAGDKVRVKVEEVIE